MERGWMIVAIVLLLAAGACLLRGATDAAFVTATLGIVSWFLSLRSRLRKALPASPEVLMDDADTGDVHED